ncbi:flagellar protein FlaG [Vibrio sp. VB16]|jgi:flagellar protein FlaG|uniref:flagellar protein FlaG n=1 Tax=Vibrio sp. VB16 TaxID=2785746 RepID=UPI0018A0A24A|nr:flagellar protein FlaG [Vibrio sp. VB16]UGA54016.1 flagellar protein FlaG [Vibrio sp. VB16]
MDISTYTSNIQSYGEPNGKFGNASGNNGGINLALDSDSATNKSVSTQKDVGKAVSETDMAEKTKAVEELVQKRIDINKVQLEMMVEKMDEFVNSINKGLSFRVDEELGRNVVTIYEASTGDIIRQIPDEEMLIILRRLAAASSSGFIIEESV